MLDRFTLGTKEAELNQQGRPEDELETPEKVAVAKRERLFQKEGKFHDMLVLKIALEDLIHRPGGFFRSSTDYAALIEDVINRPRDFAFTSLGFDVLKKDITDDELEIAKNKFLEKQKEVLPEKILAEIEVINGYNPNENVMLLDLKNRLQDFRETVRLGNWAATIQADARLRGYIAGVKNLLDTTLGMQLERGGVRKALGLKLEAK